MPEKEEQITASAGTEREVDLLDKQIQLLKVHYDQYFIGVMALPPEKLDYEVRKQIRLLLQMPFKRASTRFRLRSLIHRFQIYHTYWERIKKQKEEGTYQPDIFKAQMREKEQEELRRENTAAGAADKGLKQLYSSYTDALRKTGGPVSQVNFDVFKKSLISKARQLKQQHGVKKLHYKIIVREGKVVVKASVKD